MSIVQGHHSKGKEYACEYRIIPTEDSVRWIHERGFPIHDDQGKLTLMCGVCTDITERKLMEEALRSRERLLDKIYDILPVGLWIADKNGHLLRSNDAGKKIWGAEPLVGQEEYGVFKARRLPSGEEIAPADWALARTVNEGITVSDELLEIDAFDGEKRIVLNYTAPVLDESGKVDAAIIVNLDVTQRTRAEEALRESEEQYRAVFDNAGIGIDLLDQHGRILKVNRALLNMLGYAQEELRQLTFLDITHPDDKEISKHNLEALVAGEIDWYRLEKRYVRKDGSIVWGDLWTSTIRDANGKHVGTVAVIEDITDRKKAEQAVHESEEKYRRLHETMTDAFVSVDMTGRIQETNQAYQATPGPPKVSYAG